MNPAGWWYRERVDLPGARRDGTVGAHGEALKLRISAPPLEGRANARLRAFIAEHTGGKAKKCDAGQRTGQPAQDHSEPFALTITTVNTAAVTA